MWMGSSFSSAGLVLIAILSSDQRCRSCRSTLWNVVDRVGFIKLLLSKHACSAV